jgi:hypothetical protein
MQPVTPRRIFIDIYLQMKQSPRSDFPRLNGPSDFEEVGFDEPFDSPHHPLALFPGTPSCGEGKRNI